MADDVLKDEIRDELEIRRVVDALFVETDRKDWEAARTLFVDGLLDVDVSSLTGGGPVRITADELIAGFRVGLHAGKVSHHLVANFRFDIGPDEADVWAHGYAWNLVPALPPSESLWETWGTYRLRLQRTAAGWRLNGFWYVSKLTRGNEAVRTHISPAGTGMRQ